MAGMTRAADGRLFVYGGCGGNESLVNPTKALHPPAFLLALALETGRKLP